MTNPHEPLAGWPTAAPYESTPHTPQGSRVPALYDPQQPMVTEWVRDEQSGVPMRVLRPAPITTPEPAPTLPARDLWPARLLAGGVSVSLTAAVLGWVADDLALLTKPALALAALVLAVWLLMQTGGRKQGAVNVQVRVDNRRR